jgi:hypothetical protein
MTDVRETIKKLRMDPRVDNKPVLAVRMMEMLRGKNGGYPVHMYHETLDPVCDVDTEQMEVALAQMGYVRNYIKRSYPTWLHRRNLHPKFEENDFVESVQVASAEEKAKLLKKDTPAGAYGWHTEMNMLEPLPDASPEEHDKAIARLEGQLAEARAQAEKRGKKE